MKSLCIAHSDSATRAHPPHPLLCALEQRLFGADFVSITAASANETDVLYLAVYGADLPEASQGACHSICAHALLLDAPDQVLVIPDVKSDWRFKDLFTPGGFHEALDYHFYASAPIYLSATDDDTETSLRNHNTKNTSSASPAHVGRLTIFRSAANTPFDEEDAKSLLDIAQMIQEALEEEYWRAHAAKVRTMQHGFAGLSRLLNAAADEDIAADTYSRGSSGTLFGDVGDGTTDGESSAADNEDPADDGERRKNSAQTSVLTMDRPMRDVAETLQRVLGATAVACVDASGIPLPLPNQTATGVRAAGRRRSLAGARSSVSALLSSTPRASYPSISENSFPVDEETSTAPSISIPHGRASRHRRSASVSASASIIASSGDDSYLPHVGNAGSDVAIGEFFAHLRDQKNFTMPQRCRLTPSSPLSDTSESSDDDDNDDQDELQCVRKTGSNPGFTSPQSPLAKLFGNHVKTCLAVPIFSNSRTEPLMLLTIVWDSPRSIDGADIDFSHNIGVALGLAEVRRLGVIADRTQLAFVQMVQHEMRTPLNGILGVTESLLEGIHTQANARASKKPSRSISREALASILALDESCRAPASSDMQRSRSSVASTTSSAGSTLEVSSTLGRQLQLIHLSSTMLSQIFDDLLSLGDSRSAIGLAASAEEVGLVHEIEDTCLEELRYVELYAKHTAQSRRPSFSSDVQPEVHMPPVLIIKAPNVGQQRFRTDRTKLKRVVAKVVSNALRFTPSSGRVEVLVESDPGKNTSATDVHGLAPAVEASWIKISVRDTGCGMTSEFLEQSYLSAFGKGDVFTQGVGLGATIAHRLTGQLNGTFDVESTPGQGTCVHIRVPLTRCGAVAPDVVPEGMASTAGFDTARVFGFDQEAKALSDMLVEHLRRRNVRLVGEGEPARFIFAYASALAVPESIPEPCGANAQYIIMSRSASSRLNRQTFSDGIPSSVIKAPFGPRAMAQIDAILANGVGSSVAPSSPPETPLGMPRFTNPFAGAEKSPFGPPQTAVEALTDKVKEGRHLAEGNSATHLKPQDVSQLMPRPQLIASPLPLQLQSLASGLRPQDTISAVRPPFRVLVVEDNAINMKLLTNLLRKDKYDYVEAVDGIESVAKYKTFRPTVVLLDISLPHLDGFAACKLMRAHELGHEVRIIAITALSTAQDKVRGLEECGMDDWRLKPVSIKSLRADLAVWKAEWEATT